MELCLNNEKFSTLENSELESINGGYDLAAFVKDAANILGLGITVVTAPAGGVIFTVAGVAYCAYTAATAYDILKSLAD